MYKMMRIFSHLIISSFYFKDLFQGFFKNKKLYRYIIN